MARCFAPYGSVKDGRSCRGGGYKGPLLLPRPVSSAPLLFAHGSFGGGGAASSSESESKATAALRIHSQAEKRRRERINSHLSTLRRMIPDANKMDKAALLGRVIEQVKDLKRKAVSISQGSTIPAEVNEVTVECDTDGEHSSDNDAGGNIYIKVSVCCDDRPDLFADLVQAFRGLRLIPIRADLISMGGRVHNALVVRRKDGNGSGSLSSLKKSIKEVLDRVVCSSDVVSGKRQRVLQSHYYSNMSF